MFIITFSACNPNEDIYDDLDNAKPEYEGLVENFVFSSDDYSTASKNALKVAVTHDDSTYAKFINSMEAFNKFYTAEDYVGSIIADYFPEYGKNSRAYVTYNYVVELPEDLVMYANAKEYKFDADDYVSVGENVGIAGYLFPEFNPDFYIADVLKKSISDAVAGDISRIEYKYSEVNPVIGSSTTFKEDFSDGLGKFDTTNVVGSNGWYSSGYDGVFYASMSGQVYPDNMDNEDWLISNPIILGNDASIMFNFTHEVKYLNHRWDQLSVAISSDYDGSDISGATWDVIDWGDVADTALIGFDYDPYNSGDIDITSYANETIYIAFKYTSSTENAAKWHVMDVTVSPIKETDESVVVYGKTPYAKSDFYKYSGSDWSKVEDVYCLSDADYAAMGDPGDGNMFTLNILPQDYLPKFLDAKYPGAGNGVTKTIVYQYESDIDDEITLATQYTYNDGWESAYDYIQEVTNQFVNNGDAWLFDPTITFTMTSTNYQFIVDYVKSKISPDYIDKYGTAESYYGAGAYYSEFNISTGSWDSSVFDSWEEAVEKAIGTILLPSLYPDATTMVNGVDMYFVVIFKAYDAGDKYYSMKFQVSKEGADVEFTLVEGPTEV